MFDFLQNLFGNQNALDPTGAQNLGDIGKKISADTDQFGFLDRIGGSEGLGAIAKGIGALSELYGGIQGINLARDQLALTKENFQTNLANQTKSYNTALEGRAAARFAAEGRSEDALAEYLEKHRL
jgi:hypothetical protein